MANNAPPPPEGQAPTATLPPAGTPPEPQPQAGNGQAKTTEDYERMIAELRRENASRRTSEATTAAELKKFQDAQLSDQQKRERDFGELQTKAQGYEARLQQQALQLAGYRQGAALGIGDITAALALVQVEHGAEVKFSADGQPENIEDLLKAVLKAHPVLAAQQPGQRQQQAATSGGATNPGRQQSGGLTLEQIKAMPMRERVARMAEIIAWEKAQKQS